MAIFTQNEKMRLSKAIGFGLMPGMTCVGCRVQCYAQKGFYAWFARRCVQHWDSNLRLAMSDEFVFDMHIELLRKRAKYVRIHTEGDFFSQSYLDSWKTLARLFPDKIFYCYTKALHLSWDGLPDNFKRIQSEGGEFDALIDYTKPHTRIFATKELLDAAGYIDAYDDDRIAADATTIKIGLIAH
jgi:hypothetical protein